VKKKQKGFSLIELLIVVAIILIIAAIAIPNLLRSRMAANEASAVGSLRTINTACVTYSSTYPSVGYPGTLVALGPGGANGTSANADLVDSVLAAGTKSGYAFTFTAGAGTPSNGYSVNANAVAQGTSGTRGFFTDQSGVIRYAAGAGAVSTDSPLQ
jgi:prepilin-type N-terminal cleavage/methylation domain-containing protein